MNARILIPNNGQNQTFHKEQNMKQITNLGGLERTLTRMLSSLAKISTEGWNHYYERGGCKFAEKRINSKWRVKYQTEPTPSGVQTTVWWNLISQPLGGRKLIAFCDEANIPTRLILHAAWACRYTIEFDVITGKRNYLVTQTELLDDQTTLSVVSKKFEKEILNNFYIAVPAAWLMDSNGPNPVLVNLEKLETKPVDHGFPFWYGWR